METPRLFVAVALPQLVREQLAGLRADLGGARWTRPEQLHLTLRFLGDVEEERIPALKDALGDVHALPFELHLKGLGAFPSLRRPRVLIARVMLDEQLAALQRGVEAAVQTIGVEPEGRPFRGHVTLARLSRPDPSAVLALTRAHADFEASFGVDAFHLVASTLRPQGALHQRLATFPLRG